MRLILLYSDVARRPAQDSVGGERKDDGFAVYLSFNADPFGGSWQCKVHSVSENDWVRTLSRIGVLRPEHLCFQRERGRVRPVTDRGPDDAAAARKPIRLEMRKRAWTGDAGQTRIAKLVALSGIE